MVQKATNRIEWESPNHQLQYNRKKENNELYKAIVTMNCQFDEIFSNITNIDNIEYINEQYKNYCEFALDVRNFNTNNKIQNFKNKLQWS